MDNILHWVADNTSPVITSSGVYGYTPWWSKLAASYTAQVYFGIVIYLVLAAALCCVLAGLAYVFSLSAAQDSEKRSEYECGFEPFDSATRLPFDVHFYLVGILFLIFDVEISLLFPWVLGLKTCGWFGFYLMLGFIILLAVGFLYEWKRGALIWPARQQNPRYAPVVRSVVSSGLLLSIANTAALKLLQNQRSMLVTLKIAARLNRLNRKFRQKPATLKARVIAKRRLAEALDRSTPLLQSLTLQASRTVTACLDRNFADENRIGRVSQKFFRVAAEAILPSRELDNLLDQQTHQHATGRTLTITRGIRYMRKAAKSRRRRAATRALKLRSYLRASQKILTARPQTTRLASLKAERLKRGIYFFPLISDFTIPSYAEQFMYEFGPELYLTGLITAVLAFLALQLSGERPKKELSLESLTLLASGLRGLYFLYAVQLLAVFSGIAFHGYFTVSGYVVLLKLLTVYSVRFILVQSQQHIRGHVRSLLEYPIVMTLCLLFMLLLIGSSHLVSGFLSLVGFSLNLYVLILFDSKFASAREAGVKYFYLSTLSSGLMLYGVFLLFITLGTGQFHEIGQILAETELVTRASGLLQAAIAFLMIGVFFKLAAFPGHLWAAEVYEGSADPITAFFMLPTKVAVLAFLIHLLAVALLPALGLWQLILTVSAFFSLLWGCIAAAGETKTKRFLAYASINQMGFLLIGLATATFEGYRATLFYLFIYAIMNLGFLVIFLGVNRPDRYNLAYLTDFAGFVQQKQSSWSLTMILLSMAGIPPLMGFFGKYYLLLHAQEQTLYGLVVMGLFTSLISTFYYLRLIKIMWFGNPETTPVFIDISGEEAYELQKYEWLLWSFLFCSGPIITICTQLTTSLFSEILVDMFAVGAPVYFFISPGPIPEEVNERFRKDLRKMAINAGYLFIAIQVFNVTLGIVMGIYRKTGIPKALLPVKDFFTEPRIPTPPENDLVGETGLLVSLELGLTHLAAFLSSLTVSSLPAIVLLLTIGVVWQKRTTHGLLCLIAIFFAAAMLYLYVGAEFLAFLFLIVYVGAIAILFLFVIMLIHLKETPQAPKFVTSGIAALFIPFTIFIIVGLEDAVTQKLFEFFATNDLTPYHITQTTIDSVTWFQSYQAHDIKVFSELLYTEHCVLFFLAALLLLTAMLGAIILATQATDRDEVEPFSG